MNLHRQRWLFLLSIIPASRDGRVLLAAGRPRRKQLPVLALIHHMGKRQARARLEQLTGTSPEEVSNQAHIVTI